MTKFNFRMFNNLLIIASFMFFISCQKDVKSETKNNKKKELAGVDLASKENLLLLLQTEMFLSEAAKLGTERATEVSVKEFSEKANKNHVQIYEKIKLICEEKGYEIPEKHSKEFNDKLYKLTFANTNDFDRYYLSTLEEEYKSNIDSLAKDVNNNKYPNEIAILLEVEANLHKNLDKVELLSKK